MRTLLMAWLAVSATTLAMPAHAGYTFSFAVDDADLGTVGPSDPRCVDPFAGCELTAVATLHAVSELSASWRSTSSFSLLPPPNDKGLFATVGRFYWDDLSANNDDLWGHWTGLFDPAQFSNNGRYMVEGGSGRFSGLQGSGQTFIQVIPGPMPPFGYFEAGRMNVPEPATSALAALAALLLLGLKRRAS